MENIIKIEELRIGNYICVNNNGHSCRVMELTMSSVVVESIKENYNEPTIKSFNSIPLTKEWLLKFGFQKYGNEWKLCPCFEIQIIVFNEGTYNGLMFYTRTIHTDYTPIYCGNQINYLHQLQNLYFALTNEELTMK